MDNNEDYGFDAEFMADEEVEQMIDFLTNALAEQIEAEHSKTSIINIARIQSVSYVYKVMIAKHSRHLLSVSNLPSVIQSP